VVQLLGLLPAAISAIQGVIKKKSPEIAEALDKVLDDPQTKLELEKLAIEKLKLEQNIEKWELEDRASARELAKVDMVSDSWLSKNIRPLILIFLTGMFVAAFFLSAQNKYEMEMINTFKSLLAWVYTFYFGGRSVEKVIKILKG
jgi:hypothetical protein